MARKQVQRALFDGESPGRHLAEDQNDGVYEISPWTKILLSEYGEELRSDDERVAQAMADIFAGLYGLDYRKAEPGSSAGSTAEWLDKLMIQPEWEELQELAVAKPWICASATKRLQEQKEKEEDSGDQDGDGDEDSSAAGGLQGILADAKDEANEHDQAVYSLGGEPDSPKNMIQNLKEISDELARNDELKKLVRLAGHMAGIGAQKARRRRAGGSYESVDVEHGGLADLARALPEELLGLIDQDLEPAFMRALIDETVLVEEVRGDTPQTMGPVVLAVDESGSMSGDKIYFARAFALAMFMRCRKENRPFAVVMFSHYTRRFEYEHPRKVMLKPSGGLGLEWLETFANGGTDIGAALREAHDFIKKSKGAMSKADVILITDGESADYSEQIKRMKEEGISTFGVGLDLQRWLDGGQMVDSMCLSGGQMRSILANPAAARKLDGLAV